MSPSKICCTNPTSSRASKTCRSDDGQSISYSPSSPPGQCHRQHHRSLVYLMLNLRRPSLACQAYWPSERCKLSDTRGNLTRVRLHAQAHRSHPHAIPKGRGNRPGQRHSGGNSAYRGFPGCSPLHTLLGPSCGPHVYPAQGTLITQLRPTCGSDHL